MRKKILLAFFSIALVFTYAQKPINLFKADLSVLNIETTDIDSITFNSDKTKINIFKKDNSKTEININTIDSINFNTMYLQTLAVVDMPVLSNLLNTTASALINIKSTGGTSVIEKGICWGTSENPTIDNNKLPSTSFLASSKVDMSGLVASTNYYARAYAINSAGVSYSDQISFSTNNFSLPSIETISATFNYTTNKVTCVVKVNDNGGCALTERGICWSTKRNPTTADNKYVSGTSVGQFYAQTGTLDQNSIFYIRSFATNCMGTKYSNELSVQALMGNVTYTIQAGLETSQPEYYKLIKTAMDSTCWYYNRYTNFRGNVYVYYNAGIPTAQASYHGSIGFGPNTSYMWVGTAMHEMAHFVGSGTTTAWQSKLSGGVWTGTVASALLKSWTGETLKGDSNSNPIHFWPYGINYRNEITNLGSQQNQQEALIRHCKLVKAMVVDDAKVPSSW